MLGDRQREEGTRERGEPGNEDRVTERGRGTRLAAWKRGALERKPEGERDAGRAAEQGGGRGREGADDSVMKGFGVRSPRLWPRLEERQIEEKGRKIAAEMDRSL